MPEKYIYDPKVPKRIIRFFKEYLRHTKGIHAGKPFELLLWQIEIINDVYGTLRPDGTRRYRTVYIEVPRKNGKSTLLAGLCLYALFEETGGEVYIVASNREQAGILFGIACEMVAASPQLSKIFKIYKHSIYYPRTRSTFKVLSRDAHSALGTNPSFVTVDEILTQPDDTLYNSLKTGMLGRKNPLMFSITTAGDSKASFCYRLHEYAENIANGTVVGDDSFYGRIYGLKDDDDWENEEVWHRCNPSLGQTITLESFRTEYKQAKAMPGMAHAFKARNLNAWLSSDKAWIKGEAWEACGDSSLKLADFKGEDCFAALDLSSVSDLTALALCFRRDGKYYLFHDVFCPADTIQKRSRDDKVPYQMWADSGYLNTTVGSRVDQQAIFNKIMDYTAEFNIKELAVDRWQAEKIMGELQEAKLEVISFGQGFASMSGPSKSLEMLVLGKECVHPNNPLVNWCVSNVMLEMDAAGNYKPNKKRSKDRIDPVIATIMALGRAERTYGPAVMPEISWV